MELHFDPVYFLDSMQPLELSIILKNYGYRYREYWEQTRAQMALLANVNSKKRLTPDEIMYFPWDGRKEGAKINLRKQKAIEDKAKLFEKILKNGK